MNLFRALRTFPILDQPANRRVVPALVLIAFLIAFLNGFWLGDDSFITFRTMDNFIHGYGLRWNIDERVQSYTNPLWLFFVTPFYGITGDVYFAAFLASLVAALATAGYLIKRIDSDFKLLFVFSTLLLCKSFIEYSSSGLENVLSHFLIVLYFFQFRDAVSLSGAQTGKLIDPRAGFRLSFLFSLLILNRMDLSLLLLIPHAYIGFLYLLRIRPLNRIGARHLALFLAALMPVLFWLLFSLIYYGFPFPNTYYAKTTIPIDMVRSKWISGYYMYALETDILILIVPLVSLLVALLPGKRIYMLFAAGIILQNLYIVKIGGDFMGGRWLTAPFLLAVLILLDAVHVKYLKNFAYKQLIGGVFLLFLVLNIGNKMMHYNPFGDGISANVFLFAGTVDERQGWGGFTRLQGCITGKLCYQNLPVYQTGLQLRSEKKKITTASAIGMLGFAAGLEVKIIDVQGLSDPLLARMAGKPWAPGHCERKIPAGYDQPGQVMEDSALRDYDAGLKVITQGPLFTQERLQAILDYNLGQRRSVATYLHGLGTNN